MTIYYGESLGRGEIAAALCELFGVEKVEICQCVAAAEDSVVGKIGMGHGCDGIGASHQCGGVDETVGTHSLEHCPELIVAHALKAFNGPNTLAEWGQGGSDGGGSAP